MQGWRWAAAVAGGLAAVAGVCQAQISSTDVAPVTVVGATPIGGGLDKDKIAAPVQTATADGIARSHALDLTAFMTRKLAGVYVNDIQNNPLQPDLNYRGYTASPLLGTPQGLSVYVDGMPVNQPFGDVVSWDLIPRQAIASIALMPGSNPLFGLNTLGGALSVRTKDGLSAPGSMAQLGYGSYHRRLLEAETGGAAGNGVNWYLTGTGFKDGGWRDASPSNAAQLFGKLGWRGAGTNLALSGAYANTDLNGAGLQEQRFLARDRSSVYTKPDITQNRSGLVNFTFEHQLSPALSVSGNADWRRIETHTYNGDINDDALTEDVYQPDAGETAANTPFPSLRCIAGALLNTEPNATCDGLINRTETRQHEAGAAVQATYRSRLAGRDNQLTVGGAYNQSHAHFRQSSQFGYLTPDRGVIGVSGPGAFADGSQASETAQDARVDVTGRTRTASLYATDTLELAAGLNVTLSGRYDADRIRNRDALTPGGGPGSLDGSYRFNRFNPVMTAARRDPVALDPLIQGHGRVWH
ncbi:TonB-dependent receptor plug domain-containing protein [Phenylobacterium sp.]|uniref:TonB-dependent receptor n=1 Tax=Phenylobacterium sp. TaxID=1871053 RepID=UPI0025DFA833|nr:TonB-dependent receptor plug domain-containing protein [Phenylobacterium sp.]